MFTSTDFFDLLHVIGEECEERFGYPVEFISLPANSAKNDYLSAMQSGMEIDLIFPSKVYEHIASDYDAFYFWNDEFIEFYKDLSPYLTYYPDVYGHMQQFDYVMDMVTRGGKIYALYAGVPSVSHTTLLVKNSILQEHNIQNIRSYDELFVFMDVMAEKEEKAGKVKVSSAHYRSLLDYATVKAGYYPVHNRSHPNIVCKIDDEYVFGNKTLNRSKEYLNLAKRAMYPPLYKQLEFCHSDHYNDYKIMDSGYFNSPIIKKRTEYIENALKKLYEDPSSITADEMKVALDEMTDQDEVLKVYNDFMCKLLS